MNKNLLFRSIPKVDILLEEQEIQDLIDVYGRELVMDVIREEMDALRTFIGKCEEEEKAKAQIGMLTQNIKRHAGKLHEPLISRTIANERAQESEESEGCCQEQCVERYTAFVDFGKALRSFTSLGHSIKHTCRSVES